MIDVAGFVADLKSQAIDYGFHVHDERHFVETYSLRQLWEVDLHPEEACAGPIDLHLSLDVDQARGFMVRTERWKYVYFPAHPPQLFDLATDPAEQADLGRSPSHAEVRAALKDRLTDWALSRRTRATVTDAFIRSATGGARKRGYRFGEW